jgi:hypothetical protein
MPFVPQAPETFVAIANVPVLNGGTAVVPFVTRMSHVNVPRLPPLDDCNSTDGHNSGILTLPLDGSADPMNSTGPYPCVELRGTTK